MAGNTFTGGGEFTVRLGDLVMRSPVDPGEARYRLERLLYDAGMPAPMMREAIETLLAGGTSRGPDTSVLQGEIQRLNGIIQQLKAQPSIVGLVLRVRNGRATLLVSGRRVEVPIPKDTALTAGDSVNATGDTMQILSKVEDDIRSGEIVTLRSVLPGGMGEIERAGAARVIALPHPAEAGDRVIVDDSGTMALAVIGPEPSTCVFGESTGVSWDDIGGLATAKAQLREAIEGPFRDRERFGRFKRKPTRGVLLYGPPGTGKSMLGKAAATAIAELHGAKAGGGFYYVKGPELLNMYVGNTEAAIRKMFDGARRHRKQHGFPAVIFLDEADSILGKRGGLGFGLERTIVPAFLAEMDGLEDSGAIVLLATNRPTTLDPAIVRDGRVDRRIHVTRPSKDDARAIALRALQAKPGHAEGLAEVLVDALFSPKLAIAKVYRENNGECVRLTLGDVVNGALVVGIVERATSAAMARDAEAIEEQDVRRGVLEAFNESLDVNHDDELVEHFGELKDIHRLAMGKPIQATEAA